MSKLPENYTEIMVAWKHGKAIEYRSHSKDRWITVAAGIPFDEVMSGRDAFEYRIKPVIRVGYVNIYPNCLGSAFPSRLDADAYADESRIGCARVEVEEGQFNE